MVTLTDSAPVTGVPAADAADALAHFSALLRYETDCYDVHEGMALGESFVVLDVRGPDAFASGHLPGATNLPFGRINERNLAEYPEDTLFVVYCWGPHCNAADKAAVALSRLGRPVKKMIGGTVGWLEEGYQLEQSS